MTTTRKRTDDLFIWSYGELTIKLINGIDLVGIDSGNVRRREETIEADFVLSPWAWEALRAGPPEVRALPVVASALGIGAPIVD